MAQDPQHERLMTLEEFAQAATPEQVERVEQVAAAIAPVVERANSMQVRTRAEAEEAVAFLGAMKRQAKTSEEARKFLVDPLRKHIKAIDARFKIERAPLEDADVILRAKVVAFNDEQERLAAEERRRIAEEEARRQAEIEAQRRREEEEARAQREKAAREAAAAEAAARRAEAERRAQMDRAASELADRMAKLDDDDLDAIAADGTDEEAIAAEAELDARAKAREAQEAAARAAEAEAAARAAEEARRAAPLPEIVRHEVAAPSAVRADGTSGVSTKRWRAIVIDPDLVPARYLVVDEKAIGRAVREGVREIPGVRIEQVSGLQVRS